MNTNQKIINSFITSQDYKDICYMVDHTPNLGTMVSCIEDLNYKIGLNILTSKDNQHIKKVTLGKKGEIRVQLTECKTNYVICAIIENKQNI